MIIGFAHKKRVGKDTAGDYLVEHYGFKKIWFAKALYEDCINLEIEKYIDNNFYLFSINGSNVLRLGISEVPKQEEFYKWFDIVSVREGSHLKFKGMKEKDRWLLQWWGTEIRRQKFGENYWLRQVFEVINKDFKQDWVITDCRFFNEVNVILNNDGFVYDIIRPDLTKDGTENHASELDLDGYKNFSGIIMNDGIIDQFYNKIENIMSGLGKQKME